MAHTAYCMKVRSASGHRMVNQVGTLNFFTLGSKTARITIGFHKLVAGLITPNMPPRGLKTTQVAMALPYIATTMITQQLDRVVVVARLTASLTKGEYSYSLYGY